MSDPESSTLSKIREYGTNFPNFISIQNNFEIYVNPVIELSSKEVGFIEAFDGVMASLSKRKVTFNIVYDPPSMSDALPNIIVPVG